MRLWFYYIVMINAREPCFDRDSKASKSSHRYDERIHQRVHVESLNLELQLEQTWNESLVDLEKRVGEGRGEMKRNLVTCWSREHWIL